jgi:hypothetical protein
MAAAPGTVSRAQLAELREVGFVVVPGFLSAAEVAACRAGCWESGLPHPEAYFAAAAAGEPWGCLLNSGGSGGPT